MDSTIIVTPQATSNLLLTAVLKELFRKISAIFIKNLQKDMVLVTIIKIKKFVRGFSYENYHRKLAAHRF